jgi:hypothetical protein
MFRTFTVVDHALPEPDLVRQRALAQTFGPREYEGHTYQGVATGVELPAADLIAEALRVPAGRVRPTLQFWRLGLAGDDTTTFIHADTIASPYAVLLYLSEPKAPHAGTAFWRHRRLDTDALAPDLPPAEYERINREGHDESAWQMVGLIGQRYNRLAIYPSFLFHSRYPRSAWGGSPETGRLVWVTFFDLKEGA